MQLNYLQLFLGSLDLLTVVIAVIVCVAMTILKKVLKEKLKTSLTNLISELISSLLSKLISFNSFILFKITFLLSINFFKILLLTLIAVSAAIPLYMTKTLFFMV